jgi:hypothetical protein
VELNKREGDFESPPVENIFLISAMLHNFDETRANTIAYCKRWNVKRFISADRFNGIQCQRIEKLSLKYQGS